MLIMIMSRDLKAVLGFLAGEEDEEGCWGRLGRCSSAGGGGAAASVGDSLRERVCKKKNKRIRDFGRIVENGGKGKRVNGKKYAWVSG